ncbi:hypothetical protein RCF98_02050 [Thiothrix lacustris]|uniref:YbgF trimerisation domain-containing protein n=1 Tax=Thiothrix lacustris TaxID=525917 RepID=A0ABY9MRV0_9GAMM|nr:hypothetical protein [Thiothrix lacustris]WML91147.1 hypothetical protein RCF98_02050 [Thiothrix lacustris]
MPKRDPITVVGVVSTVLLVTGGAMLYLAPPPQTIQPQAQLTNQSSPFKEPLPAPTPIPVPPPPPPAPAPAPAPEKTALRTSTTLSALSPPELTEDDLAQLTPSQRSHYETLRKSLQSVLTKVQTLEEENTKMQQALDKGDEKNQVLDAEINKLRSQQTPEPAKATPPPP